MYAESARLSRKNFIPQSFSTFEECVDAPLLSRRHLASSVVIIIGQNFGRETLAGRYIRVYESKHVRLFSTFAIAFIDPGRRTILARSSGHARSLLEKRRLRTILRLVAFKCPLRINLARDAKRAKRSVVANESILEYR